MNNVTVKNAKRNENPEIQLKLDEISKMYSENYSFLRLNKLHKELNELVKKYQ